METITDTRQGSAMPTAAPAPARTVAEQLAAIGAGAGVNEFYELVYPAA